MTNPHTTNFDFPTVYEYKRLCIDHPVRNQKIPRLDRHSVPYARQNGRTPVSDRNRDYRIHRRGNRPRRIGASGEKILKRKRVGFFESMFKYGVFRKLTAIIPPLMVSALLPFAFSKDSAWFILSEKITWIYFSSP